jgi:hypothetical protein
LRRELHAKERIIAELRGEIPDSDTYVIDYLHGDTPLPKGARVAFRLGPDDGRIRRNVQAYIEEPGTLYIQGDYGLAVLPSASNALRIKLDMRR